MLIRNDLTGRKFGRLTVKHHAGKNNHGKSLWLCVCDCGSTTTIAHCNLITGNTESCGCLKKELLISSKTTHNHRYSPIYDSWCNMLRRCTNPKDARYPDYGGRGITICEHWLKFENFLADMGEKPEGMQLDRKDNNGNYEPSNCRWTTSAINNINRRNTIFLTFKEETKPLKIWSNITGIPYQTLHSRYKKGWSSERILNMEE